MQFKHLKLASSFLRNIHRSYVSAVDVHVKSLASIKVKSKDFYEKENQEVKLTVFDEHQKELDVGSIKTLELLSTKDAFKFKYLESKQLSIILELPIESSPEIELEIKAEKSKIQVEGMQTKSVKIDLKTGDVLLKNLKSDLIKAETEQGNIFSKSLLLGKKIDLEAENGEISIEKSQGDYIEVEGASVKVDSCYNTHNKFTSTRDMILKNLHGVSTIKSSGENFKLSGFSGSIKAQLNNKNIEMQLSELYGDNEISSTNSNSFKLGFSEVIIGDTTVKIESDCKIENSVPELMICMKNEESFEVKKKNPERNCNLKVKVENGKILELTKMSWIDSLNLKQNSEN